VSGPVCAWPRNRLQATTLKLSMHTQSTSQQRINTECQSLISDKKTKYRARGRKMGKRVLHTFRVLQ